MKRILDIGCGQGERTDYLSKIKGNLVWGIDVDKKNIEICKKNNKKVQYFVGTAEKLDFKGDYFDEIYLNEVLEHVQNVIRTLKNIRKVLKPKAKLFLSVPLKESEAGLKKMNPSYPKEIGHKREFSKEEIIDLMTKRGFKVLSYKKYNSFEHFYWMFLLKRNVHILNQNAKIKEKYIIIKIIKELLNQDNFYIYKKRGVKNNFILFIKTILFPFSRFLDLININKKQSLILEKKSIFIK